MDFELLDQLNQVLQRDTTEVVLWIETHADSLLAAIIELPPPIGILSVEILERYFNQVPNGNLAEKVIVTFNNGAFLLESLACELVDTFRLKATGQNKAFLASRPDLQFLAFVGLKEKPYWSYLLATYVLEKQTNDISLGVIQDILENYSVNKNETDSVLASLWVLVLLHSVNTPEEIMDILSKRYNHSAQVFIADISHSDDNILFHILLRLLVCHPIESLWCSPEKLLDEFCGSILEYSVSAFLDIILGSERDMVTTYLCDFLKHGPKVTLELHEFLIRVGLKLGDSGDDFFNDVILLLE